VSPSSSPRLHLFDRTEEGRFISRRNRFVIECLVGNAVHPVYLPNPGRLRELLLPGRKLYLAENAAGAKFTWTAVAVERDGQPILLHTHMANRVVEWLLLKRAIPGFEDAAILKREVLAGHSRFDFLLQKNGSPFLLEVKSCTLFQGAVAMFPDAVTDRGRRHLMELAEMARRGTPAGVVVLIHKPDVRWFLPDYHTDLAFARAMSATRNAISFTALSVAWDTDLSLSPSTLTRAVIPWDMLEREACDGGSYILIIRLNSDRHIEIGGLGVLLFRRGYYLYVGSAQTGMSGRIGRHLRKRRHVDRHIDYLRNEADGIKALPVRSSEHLECALVDKLGELSEWSIPGFGCSGCTCESHLVAVEDDPERDEDFIGLLQYFRIGRLQEMLEGKEIPHPG